MKEKILKEVEGELRREEGENFDEKLWNIIKQFDIEEIEELPKKVDPVDGKRIDLFMEKVLEDVSKLGLSVEWIEKHTEMLIKKYEKLKEEKEDAKVLDYILAFSKIVEKPPLPEKKSLMKLIKAYEKIMADKKFGFEIKKFAILAGYWTAGFASPLAFALLPEFLEFIIKKKNVPSEYLDMIFASIMERIIIDADGSVWAWE